jgi:hypothetical protein
MQSAGGYISFKGDGNLFITNTTYQAVRFSPATGAMVPGGFLNVV